MSIWLDEQGEMRVGSRNGEKKMGDDKVFNKAIEYLSVFLYFLIKAGDI